MTMTRLPLGAPCVHVVICAHAFPIAVKAVSTGIWRPRHRPPGDGKQVLGVVVWGRAIPNAKVGRVKKVANCMVKSDEDVSA